MQTSHMYHGNSVMAVYSDELRLVEKAHARLLHAVSTGKVAKDHLTRVNQRLQGQLRSIARLNQLIEERQLGAESEYS